MTVAESQTAEFECEVANADAEGKWLKDGQLVDFSENIMSEVLGAVRRLVIVITRPQDVGEYTYQVANSKTSANLKVEGEYQILSARLEEKTLSPEWSSHDTAVRDITRNMNRYRELPEMPHLSALCLEGSVIIWNICLLYS